MTTFLTILVVLSMLATLGVLAAGLIGLARSGEGSAARARSNNLMRWRVVLQGVALGLFALLLSFMHRGG